MSLTSTTRRNDYVGSSAVSVYAYGFRVFSQSDLLVKVEKTSDATVTTLTITTDYTVSGVGTSAGGSITLVNASQAWLTSGKLSTGYTLTILRIVDIVQETDIRNQGSFFPETHENEFDYLTMIDGQQQDQLDRSPHLPETVDPSAFDTALPPNPSDYPGSAIVVNAAGDGFELSVSDSTVPSYVIQSTAPSNPGVSQLAFWYDTSLGQMKIWCRTEWRMIA